jgi:hypothetical protein
MLLFSRAARWGALAVAVAALSACAPSAYIVKSPTPSTLPYQASAQPSGPIALVDERPEADKSKFNTGLLAATLNTDGGTAIDPPEFLAKHLQAELAARGVAAPVSRTATGLPKLHLKTFRMVNHRASGFSPFVTFTYLSADLETAAGSKPIGVFVKRGKVPVMTFDEVVEPTLNQPLSLAVKELAAKIALQLNGARASDTAVDEIAARLAKRDANSFLDVYALGFTNNPRAVSTLVGLVGDSDEYVRLAALSSLGTLRATGQLQMLKGLYENRSGLWQDRAMALKAIADMDTPESREYVAAETKRWEAAGGGNEASWTLQLLKLYQR